MTSENSGNESLIKYLKKDLAKDKPYIISSPSSKKQQLVDKQIDVYNKSNMYKVNYDMLLEWP